MLIKINDNEVMRLFKDMEDIPRDSMRQTFRFYKKETPIRSGNARNKTKLSGGGLTIKSAYPYAGRLDEGWSQQAPDGFTEPSIDKLDQIIDAQIRRITRG